MTNIVYRSNFLLYNKSLTEFILISLREDGKKIKIKIKKE